MSDYNPHKLDDLLGKFENGKERFQTDPVFHKVILSLYQGADPISLLDQVLNMRRKTQEAYSDYVKNDTRPISFKILDKNQNLP